MRYRKALLLLSIILLPIALGGCASSTPGLIQVTDNKTLKAISYDPSSGGLLKVVPSGVFRARDAAATWVPLSLRGPLPLSGLSQVAMSWENPKIILTSGPDAGVLESTDAGQTWTGINSGLPGKQVSALATHIRLPNTFFSAVTGTGQGVYKTENGGSAWKRMDDGPPVSRIDALAHSTLPGSMNTGWLYAASPEGLYLSMDCF